MAEEQKQLFELVEELLETGSRAELGRILSEQRTSDISEVIEILDNDQRRVVFDLLGKHDSADVLEKVDEATRAELFDLFEEKELTELISELNPDDAADILSEMPQQDSKDLLEHMPADEADQIKGLMSYSEDSAGGIMDPVLVSVNENATIAGAIRKIQEAEIDEEFFSVFIVNSKGRFLGDVRIRDLLKKREDTPVKQFINTDTIYVRVNTDQEEVRNIFSKNDLIVVPVLDQDNVLVGRITADRVIEVAEEEAAEDIYAMAGTDAAELGNISVIHAARVRMTWLMPCLAGTAVTAIVLLLFGDFFAGIKKFLVYDTAVAFVPMIAAISGNAGLQTSAIVVSGLATGDLAALRIGQVFAREVRIAIFVAISCGIVGGLFCGFLPNLFENYSKDIKAASHRLEGMKSHKQQTVQTLAIAERIKIVTAFTIAMFSAIMVSTTLGLFLPFLFRKVKIDPAISSGPLVTTANDSISVAIYLTLVLILA